MTKKAKGKRRHRTPEPALDIHDFAARAYERSGGPSPELRKLHAEYVELQKAREKGCGG